MAGKRQPIELLQAKGAKHLTKAEIFGREESEVKAEAPKFVRPPAFLPEECRKEFSEISRQLLDLNIFSKLDRDTLAMYLVARHSWEFATDQATAALNSHNLKLASEWTQIQDRYFKQVRSCASDLGLTITSRCRLVIPKKQDDEPADPMEALLFGRGKTG